MHILYLSAYPENYYREVARINPGAIAPASQKFNHLLVKGIRENNAEIEVLCTQDVLSSLKGRKTNRAYDIEENGIVYHIPPFSSNRILNYMKTASYVKHTVEAFQKKYEDAVVFLDYLMPHVKDIVPSIHHLNVLVTDLPEYIYVSSDKEKNERRIKAGYDMISSAEHAVIMTKEMKEKLKVGQPALVLEGMVDSSLRMESNKTDKKNFLLYAGAVSHECGIPSLVKAFVTLDPDYELLIYGRGNYVEELKKICSASPKVRYMGLAGNEEILALEKQAALLINPRPVETGFARYSFPSKNMEYMASGTALLTTKLTGMPEEYYPYVYLFPNDDAEGIQEGLKHILSLPQAEREEKGRMAQKFVLEKKNCRVQAEKVLRLMEQCNG